MFQGRLFESGETVFTGLQLFEGDTRLARNAPELVSAWEKAYPNLDLKAEIARAHSWQLSHPSRRKKSQSKFIDNWLRRASTTPKETWNVSAKSVAEAIKNAMGG